MTIYEFVDSIQQLRTLYPMSATSWFRTQKRNAKVGGVSNSYHRLGLAVDIVMDDEFVYTMHIFANDARQVGLQALYEGDHWHLEPLP